MPLKNERTCVKCGKTEYKALCWCGQYHFIGWRSSKVLTGLLCGLCVSVESKETGFLFRTY